MHGNIYEFHITANPGDMLSFTFMLMRSNDIIYGPKDGRLQLFTSNGILITGDVTTNLGAFDAGTEVNDFDTSAGNPLFGIFNIKPVK